MGWEVVLFSRHRNPPGMGTSTTGKRVCSPPCTLLDVLLLWKQMLHLGPELRAETVTAPGEGKFGGWRCLWAHSARGPTPACAHASQCVQLALGSCLILGSSSQLLLLQIPGSPSCGAAIPVTLGSFRAHSGFHVLVLPAPGQLLVQRGVHECSCLTRTGEPSTAHVLLAPFSSRSHQMAHPPPSIPHPLGRRGTSSGCLRALAAAGDPLPSWAGSPKVPSHVQGLSREGTQLHQSQKPGWRRRSQPRGKL